jgi:ribosomal protein S18 acetylase RimI-like enzyme
MAAATNWAVNEGCDSMFLQVLATNDAALGLYGALGYAEVYRYGYLEPVVAETADAIDGC